MGQLHLDNLSNEAILASYGMQQFPKILNALNNMARRSRQQLQRKRIFLGGLWFNEDEIEKRTQGILKKQTKPSFSRLTSCNDLWKSYSLTNNNEGLESSCPSLPSSHWSISTNHPELTESLNKYLCSQFLQGEVYKLQESLFPGIKPLSQLCEPSVKGVLLCHLKDLRLNGDENRLLLHLRYLQILSNIPIHKLLRERPKEFVLPLPRRPLRGGITPALNHSRSLMGFQCVGSLPKKESKAKWPCNNQYNSNRYVFNYFEFGDDPALVRLMNTKQLKSGKGYSFATTIPKGVSFLTYPDSLDETSFEGTIGGRNVISWDKDTKFPQMGIDQSWDFKYRKELSRQQMIQNRLRAARLQKRTTYRIEVVEPVKRSPFWYIPDIRRLIPKALLKPKSSSSQVHPSWFKLTKLRKTFGLTLRRNNGLSLTKPTVIREGDEILRCPRVDDTMRRLILQRRAAQKAERRKRRRLRIMTVLKYLSCGIVGYIITGECKIFRRKRQVLSVDRGDQSSTEMPLDSQANNSLISQ